MSSLTEEQVSEEAKAEATAAAATTEADKVEVTDVNMLVQLLARWHSRKVKVCEHLLQIPDGQVIQIGDDPELHLTGDANRAFRAGINMALMEFGILPFSFEIEAAANDSTAANAG